MDDAILIEVQRLFALVHHHGLRELSLKRPDFSIAIKARAGVVIEEAEIAQRPIMRAPAASRATEPVPAEATANQVPILSPLVGIFYRAPAPDMSYFVDVGDTVEVGQPIGIIEAMKVFNEITSDHAGVVVAVPAENGKLVQVGQPLVVIDTSL